MNFYSPHQSITYNHPDPTWLKILYRHGKALQAQELIQEQQLASKHIGAPFQYLIGYFRVIQGLGITVAQVNNKKVIRQAPGKVAIYYKGRWAVYYIPPHEIPYIDSLYLGVYLTEVTSTLDPDPILGGPTLGLRGNPYLQTRVNLTTAKGVGFPLAEVIEGQVYKYQDYLPTESHYEQLAKELRHRLYEELGDFIASGLEVNHINPYTISVSPGVAYIRGYRVQTHLPQVVELLGSTVYLTQSGKVICPPFTHTHATVGKVYTQQGLVKHRVNLPILVRVQVTAINDPLTEARVELCTFTPSFKDSRYRLPPSNKIFQLHSLLLDRQFKLPEVTTPDDYHPLYTASVTSTGITLGRYLSTLSLPNYSPPSDPELYAWQGGLTEYNACPNTMSPFLTFEGGVLKAYNLPLTPLALTCKGQGITPLGSENAQISEGTVTPLSNYITLTIPYSCTAPRLGPYGISQSPLLDNGLAQEFDAPTPIQVTSFSFYTQGSFTGLIALSSGGKALSWAPVIGESGQVYAEFPTPVLVSGTFRLHLISNTSPLIGVYDTGSGTTRTESVYSKNLALSVSNQWVPVPNKDLACELYIAKGVPSAEYEVNIPIDNGEAFDGLAPRYILDTPTGSSIQMSWYIEGQPVADISSIPSTNQITLRLRSKIGPQGQVPTLKGQSVDLFITRKESTWVGRDEEQGQVYNQVLVLVDYYAPPGTNIKPFFSSDGGRTWFGLDLDEVQDLGDYKYQAKYRAIDLPPSLQVTDVNGEVYQAPRTKGRARLDLSTQSPDVRPIVYDVKALMSYV